RRVVGRVPALQDARAAGGRQPFGGEQVLDRDRDSGQRASCGALLALFVDGGGLLKRAVGGGVQERVHAVVHGGDPVQVRPGHLGRGDLSSGQRGGQLRGRHAGEFHGVLVLPQDPRDLEPLLFDGGRLAGRWGRCQGGAR